MQVRVDELLVFSARRALSAAVFRQPVFAIDILGIGNGQRQAAAALRTEKKLRMAHPVFIYGTDEVLLDLLLPDNRVELHMMTEYGRWMPKGTECKEEYTAGA